MKRRYDNEEEAVNNTTPTKHQTHVQYKTVDVHPQTCNATQEIPLSDRSISSKGAYTPSSSNSLEMRPIQLFQDQSSRIPLNSHQLFEDLKVIEGRPLDEEKRLELMLIILNT